MQITSELIVVFLMVVVIVQSAPKGRCSSSETKIILNKTNPSYEYYICQETEIIEFNCPSGLVFNKRTNVSHFKMFMKRNSTFFCRYVTGRNEKK